MANSINWFDIPAAKFDRAIKFYSKVLDVEMHQSEMGGTMYGFFPGDYTKGDITGALVCGEGYKPSSTGTTVYLDGGDDLSIPLSRVEEAGGKVLLPKTKIPSGYIAKFLDSEGNQVAFGSPN